MNLRSNGDGFDAFSRTIVMRYRRQTHFRVPSVDCFFVRIKPRFDLRSEMFFSLRLWKLFIPLVSVNLLYLHFRSSTLWINRRNILIESDLNPDWNLANFCIYISSFGFLNSRREIIRDFGCLQNTFMERALFACKHHQCLYTDINLTNDHVRKWTKMLLEYHFTVAETFFTFI